MYLKKRRNMNNTELDELRSKIDEIDKNLCQLIIERQSLASKIMNAKKGSFPFDPNRKLTRSPFLRAPRAPPSRALSGGVELLPVRWGRLYYSRLYYRSVVISAEQSGKALTRQRLFF